jgi:glyoxylase-like metal-dependent hydrolase (beta-lactamase superfamily II)
MRRIRLLVLVCVAFGLPGASARAQGPQPGITDDQKRYVPGRPVLHNTPFEVLPVQGNIYLLSEGKSANVVLQAGEQGAFLVDSGTPVISERIIAAIRERTKGSLRGIVNTTMDLDHIGGNPTLAKTGLPLFGLSTIGAPVPDPEANIFAHEKALNRIAAPAGQVSAIPVELWPSNTFMGAKKKLYFNHEPIELQYAPGHTDGDIIVFFRKSDVIAAGDVFSTMMYPRFDPARGGSIQGILDGLNRLIDIAIPEFNQQGGTRIIPGHGRIANQSDVVEYRDMATIVRDRVRDLKKAGKTLAQVKAAGATLEYDALYTIASYTGEMFVEAIYNDPKLPAVPAPAPKGRATRKP